MRGSVPYYLRHPDLVVLSHASSSTFMLAGRPPLTLEGDPARVAAALKALRAPQTIEDLESALELRDVFQLVAGGFLLSSDDPDALLRQRGEPTTKEKPLRHLVLGVTGAIGAVNAIPLAWHLFRHVANRVDVVLTSAAQKLVRAEAFAYLGIDVWTDAFEPRHEVNVPHIFLAGADLVIVAPASAHTIHELATGACSELLSLALAATRAPVVVAPSMNAAMWENPAIADNVALLRRRGIWIVEPTDGLEVSEKNEASWAFGPASLDPDAWSRIIASVLAAKGA